MRLNPALSFAPAPDRQDANAELACERLPLAARGTTRRPVRLQLPRELLPASGRPHLRHACLEPLQFLLNRRASPRRARLIRLGRSSGRGWARSVCSARDESKPAGECLTKRAFKARIVFPLLRCCAAVELILTWRTKVALKVDHEVRT